MFHKSANASFSASEAIAVALLDARFIRWLAHLDDADSPTTALSRSHLAPGLARALDQAHLRRALRRIYWYAEVDDRAVVDDQTLRLVPADDGDGATLVRQMAADIAALVAGGRVDLLLVGSDDDRLMPAIDAAKLAGLTVCLLVDERGLAMPRLMQQDPNWARLLREADRRLVIRSADLAQALSHSPSAEGRMSQGSGSASAGLEGAGQAGGEFTAPRYAPVHEAELRAVVDAWWQDQSEDERAALRDELPSLRGLPPEVDREMLLRGKNALARALNFHEKRSLRAHARAVALGQVLATDGAPVRDSDRGDDRNDDRRGEGPESPDRPPAD